jgi:chromosome segregation ATPase
MIARNKRAVLGLAAGLLVCWAGAEVTAAQAAKGSPELQELTKQANRVRSKIYRMKRGLHKDADIAPLVKQQTEARDALNKAVLTKAATMDEHKAAAQQLVDADKERAAIEKQVADLNAKFREARIKQRKASSGMTKVRNALVPKDPKLAELSAASKKASQALDAKIMAKLKTNPEAVKLLAEHDRLKAERAKLRPKRKPRAKGKGQAGKKTDKK